MLNKEFAPIALFVYNRPEHTRRTVETLKRNIGADRTDLYVFCDYAKNEKAYQAMCETREYVKSMSGFASVTIIERTENFGLSKSIITGVTEVVNRHGKVIVMEDDLITSEFFLEYMNLALEKYESNKQVFSITGYSHFKNGTRGLPQSYFLKVFSSWGWAIWKDRWELFDSEAAGWEEIFADRNVMRDFDYDGCLDNCEMLKNQMQDHIIDSWAIRAYYCMYKNSGVTLFPNQRLCENIGNDGSGVHCGADNGYEVTSLKNFRVTEFPENALELSQSKKSFIKNKHSQKRKYKIGRIKFYITHPVTAIKKIISRI